MATVEERLAELEAAVILLEASAARVQSLTQLLSSYDSYQSTNDLSITQIEQDITLIKQQLSIILQANPDIGSGRFVTTGGLTQVLQSYDSSMSSYSSSITDINQEISNIKQWLTMLAAQLDPALAGTAIMMHGANDEEVSTTSSSWTTLKSGRICRSEAFYFTKLILRAEVRITGGGRGYVGVFINNDYKFDVSTVASSYTYLTEEWDWPASLVDDIWYPITFRLRAIGGGTVSNLGLDCIVRKPGAS